MINAYTFESTVGKVKSYDPLVDARVRRDLFNGNGNLIIVGDRNGALNDKPINGTLDNFELTLSNSVTFVAGGRLFSAPGERIRLTPRRSPGNINYATAQLCVDVNTKSADGQFVKFVQSTSYSESPLSWERPQFSSVYTLVCVNTPQGINVYPGPDHVGVNQAGGTVNICTNGRLMDSHWASARGALASYGDLYLTQTGINFTLSGRADDWKFTSDGAVFGKQNGAPFGLSIESGAITVWAKGWACMGDLTSAKQSDGSGYNFKLTNISFIAGSKPSRFNLSVHVLANFSGSWQYF